VSTPLVAQQLAEAWKPAELADRLATPKAPVARLRAAARPAESQVPVAAPLAAETVRLLVASPRRKSVLLLVAAMPPEAQKTVNWPKSLAAPMALADRPPVGETARSARLARRIAAQRLAAAPRRGPCAPPNRL
jgi:hypothetical protein